MKSTAQIIAGMFIVASMSASCDSCNKKKDDLNHSTTTTTETVADTTITADATAIEPSTSTADNAAAPKRTNTNASSKNSGETAKDQDGYSAADGTDAENHDGDQYTRNDQKAMPSGPPMK